MDINILEIILSFHKTLYDLILLNDTDEDDVNETKTECIDCIASSGLENKVCTNKHGMTRCSSTTDIFLDTILFANNSHTLVLNNFGQSQCGLDIWEDLLKRTNCSWEFFENKLPNYNTVFIDSVHLDNRITELLESTRSDKNI